MKEIMDHWLFWLVVIFLLGMILYGHYRGLIHKILTVSSLIVGMVFARIAVPYVTGLLRKHTNLYSVIGKALLKVAGGPGAELGDLLPAQQRELIGRLHLPSQMKDALLANNNYEIYKLLGVDAFWGYLERSLSNMVLNLIVSVLVFMVAFFLLRGIGIWSRDCRFCLESISLQEQLLEDLRDFLSCGRSRFLCAPVRLPGGYSQFSDRFRRACV